MTTKVRILLGEATTIGPGKIALLEAIDHHGSISAAARRLGMSYRRAWQLVNTMNLDFTTPLVEVAKGGAGGGGAHLTVLGREVISRYQTMAEMAHASIESHLSAFIRLLADTEPDSTDAVRKSS